MDKGYLGDAIKRRQKYMGRKPEVCPLDCIRIQQTVQTTGKQTDGTKIIGTDIDPWGIIWDHIIK